MYVYVYVYVYVCVCACVQVLKDKLNYYSKRDDYRLKKEPEAYIRMSQVRKRLMFGYRSGNVQWHILIPGLSWPL